MQRVILAIGQRPASHVSIELPHCLAVRTVNGPAAGWAFDQ
jgi:hypothetical protein